MKNITHKTINCLLIAAVFIIIAVAAGCAPKHAIDPGKTKIEFWTISLSPTYNDYVNGMIAEYEKQHPDVQIEWLDIPMNAIKQKLMASIAGGVPPDVVNVNTEFAQLMAQNNAIVNMDSAVPDVSKALYFEGLWNAAKFEDKNFAIPWYVTTRLVIYNKELFKKAGLDPEKPPTTLEEVGQYARQIKEKTGEYGYFPIIKFLDDLQADGVPIVSKDMKTATFNSPEGLAMLDWYTNLYKEKVIPDETLTEGLQGAVNLYQGGKLGMLIAGPTFINRIEKDAPGIYKVTGVGPMPTGKTGIIPAATMNLIVPISSKNREKAVDFALFVTNDKNQLQFCKLVPMLPSTKKAAEDEFFRQDTGKPLQDKARKISIEQLFKARDLSLGLKNQNDLNRAIKEMLESSFYGRTTTKQAIDKAVKDWNEVLNR
ncbi:MAG: ABC transporter substrate-binding protein [Firmicutes bacterium]|nr:ABC transporter substrate-binding protein [Bacillota bacterium]